MTNTIDRFHGDHRFLSNFWPVNVMFDGAPYPSVENAYQAAKTIDWQRRVPFRYMPPGEAKDAGRRLPLRPEWEAIQLSVMRDLLVYKFAHGTALADRLLATGDADLVEGNTWGDTYWGVCNGRGTNHLGRLLMEVRVALARGRT